MAKFKTAITVGVDPLLLADLIGRLRGIEQKAVKPALRKGMNEVAKLILAEAKSRVPRGTGLLRKSLGRRVRVDKQTGGYLGIVSPRRGFKMVINGKPVDPRRFAHLVEYGRAPVVATRKKVLSSGIGGKVFGKRVRGAAPRPFLRPAWFAVKPLAAGIMQKYLRQALVDAWNRASVRFAA